jgi:hypothetical protein
VTDGPRWLDRIIANHAIEPYGAEPDPATQQEVEAA